MQLSRGVQQRSAVRQAPAKLHTQFDTSEEVHTGLHTCAQPSSTLVVAQSAAVVETETKASQAPKTQTPIGGDPWKDEKWRKYKWTVYRGVAYDLTAFMDRHPGGKWLLNLAVGRDATALFESYHLRPEVAVSRLKRLPVLADFPIEAVPRAPYPNDSDLYNTIRERVRKEVFNGTEIKGMHRSGSEGAALAVLSYAVLTYALYTYNCNPLSGALMGLGGAWIGTIQHCGNHGAMSTNSLVNYLLGLTNDLSGGSSLMWRYHHQVSHHIHSNDDALDEDVFNASPFLRFDDRLPGYWYHKYQAAYMWVLFPFLHLAFQIFDWTALFTNRTVGATLHGATHFERGTFVAGKLAHYTLIYGLPFAIHGGWAMLAGAASYLFTHSIVLAAMFFVSHNVPEAKPLDAGTPTREHLDQHALERDWGVQQVLTSANWGGVVANFFTGGLNLQIEHHLFPAISFMHYPAIAKIVEDECTKRGILYAKYDTLPQITSRFMQYMSEVGVAPQRPVSRDGQKLMLAKY